MFKVFTIKQARDFLAHEGKVIKLTVRSDQSNAVVFTDNSFHEGLNVVNTEVLRLGKIKSLQRYIQEFLHNEKIIQSEKGLVDFVGEKSHA